MRLAGRLILIVIGYCLAAIVGCAVGLIGMLHWALVWLGEHSGPHMLDIILTNMAEEAAKPWAGAGVFTAVVLAPLAFIALAAVIGEIFAIRNWLAWTFGLGAAFAAIPTMLARGGAPASQPVGVIGFLAAGIAAGCVYWLVAGRGAGVRSQKNVPSNPQAETGA